MKIKQNILILVIVIVGMILALTTIVNILLKRPKIKERIIEEEVKARVAIVIDDWGYNLNYLSFIRQINAPIAVSILPNLRYSSEVAEEAHKQGKVVILHLPLEPKESGRDYIGLEQNTITAKMSKDEIIDKFRVAIDSVPYVRGISNHMGSEATKNEQVMSVIFSELKKRDLFFLDNLVTNKSICQKLAKQMKVKFVSRDFFLDNKDDIEYIKEQLKKLIAFALKNGSGVGIAHAKGNSLRVLQDTIPLMQDKGIDFVFVSDLAK